MRSNRNSPVEFFLVFEAIGDGAKAGNVQFQVGGHTYGGDSGIWALLAFLGEFFVRTLWD